MQKHRRQCALSVVSQPGTYNSSRHNWNQLTVLPHSQVLDLCGVSIGSSEGQEMEIFIA